MGLEQVTDFDSFIELAVYSTYNTSAEVNALVRLFQLYSHKVESVLDIGCGYGRHSFELASRGFRVEGFDIADGRVALAQSKTNENPRFTVGDMRSIPFSGPYDAAIALYSTVASLTDIQDTSHLMAEVLNRLNEGGLFIFDYFYPTNLVNSGRYKEFLSIEWENKGVHFRKDSKHTIDLLNHIHCEDTKYTATQDTLEVTFTNEEILRYYEPQEIAYHLAHAGFSRIYLYDRSTLRAIDVNTAGILVVAVK